MYEYAEPTFKIHNSGEVEYNFKSITQNPPEIRYSLCRAGGTGKLEFHIVRRVRKRLHLT